MKYVLLFTVVAAVLILSGCMDLFGPSPQTLAEALKTNTKALIDKMISGGTPSYDELLKVLYVRDSDKNDSDIKTQVMAFPLGLALSFGAAGTPTKIEVAGVVETKFWPVNITDKPSFIDKVYSVTYVVTTTDSTKTSVTLPMVTVTGKDTGYFYTLYIKTTGSSTSVEFYPEPVELVF
ncbi:MAG: hypothetical protein WHT65_00875 [Pseudothermotoga sp.]